MANINFTMKQYTGSDYNTLYPKNTSQQVLLNDSDLVNFLALSGANKTANDAFNAIVPLNKKIWWKRTVSFGEYKADASLVAIYRNTSNSVNTTRYYSSSISINQDTGLVSLSGTISSVSFTYINHGAATLNTTLKGKYWATSSSSNTVYYTPSNAPDVTYTTETVGSSTYYVVNISSQRVYGQVSYGDWSYEWSDNESAHTEGIANGYEYRYMPDYLTFTHLAPKTQSGEYIGVDNDVVLTFDFLPSIIFITPTNSSASSYFIWGATYTNVSFSGNTVTLSTMKTAGTHYKYIALG